MSFLRRLFQFIWRAKAVVALILCIPVGLLFIGVGGYYGYKTIETKQHYSKVVEEGVVVDAVKTKIVDAGSGKYFVEYQYEYDGKVETGKTVKSYGRVEAENKTNIKLYIYEDEVYEGSVVENYGILLQVIAMGLFVVLGAYAIIQGFVGTIRIFKATKIKKEQEVSVYVSGSINDSSKSGVVIKCPACGKMTELNNIGFCPICNTLVNEEMFEGSNSASVASKQENAVNSFCTNCGAKVNSGASFCTQCGTKINK